MHVHYGGRRNVDAVLFVFLQLFYENPFRHEASHDVGRTDK
jgi:uncharacterized protein (UPF0210 family)